MVSFFTKINEEKAQTQRRNPKFNEEKPIFNEGRPFVEYGFFLVVGGEQKTKLALGFRIYGPGLWPGFWGLRLGAVGWL